MPNGTSCPQGRDDTKNGIRWEADAPIRCAHSRQILPKIELALQYLPITAKECDRFHNRFLIIDDTVYHLGASLKDLGKKLFAFSRMEVGAEVFS